MILERIEDRDGHVYLIGRGYTLTRVHRETVDCYRHGCVVHSPTPTATANVENWPYNWRDDVGIMERICPHGVGHPDPDAASYHHRIGHDFKNVHGCDGCDCS